MTTTSAPEFTNTSTPAECWAGYVTLATGTTRPAMVKAGVVYYDKAPTAKTNWGGFHKAPAKLAASYVETNPNAAKW
jgi:dienelactone hydrolase